MYCIMLLVVVAGPGLISRDLRFNALPLYFSRPLTRLDYFVGKLGVIGRWWRRSRSLRRYSPIWSAFVSVSISAWSGTPGPCCWPAWRYGLVITLSAGTLILAMSSLTRRSLYVGIAWAGLWLIGGAVGSAP